MKFLILALGLSLSSSFASAYCDVNQATTEKIDQVRTVELPVQVVAKEIKETLLADKCVARTLNNKEIDTLIEMLLNFENSRVLSEEIIGEFLAL